MYFVDREKILEILSYMETCMKTFENQEEWNSAMEKLAFERLVHVLIESVIDVGNQMIDGFIMRDPGSYADIVDILCDEKVISAKDGEALKALIEERKELVRSYIAVNHNELGSLLGQSLSSLKEFPDKVRRYLDEELGPVSAFLPEEKEHQE